MKKAELKEKYALKYMKHYLRTLFITADARGVSIGSYTSIQPPKDTRQTWAKLVGARESVEETPWDASQAKAIADALRRTAKQMDALAERLRLDELRR